MENPKKEEQGMGENNCDIDTLRSLFAFKGTYHHHKETMAHATVLIQLALVTALFNVNFKKLCYSDDKLWIFLSYSIIWAIISFYMCWQFKMRRIAQWQVDKILEAIQVHYSPSNNTHKFIKDNMRDVQDDPIGMHCFKDKCKKVIGCIICCDNNFWRKVNQGEIILWIADVLILVIGVLRIISIG
ncbi:MAG: hypothetical protein WC496_08725 [Phycisphaerae bacterium]|jgi:hypothetical protein